MILVRFKQHARASCNRIFRSIYLQSIKHIERHVVFGVVLFASFIPHFYVIKFMFNKSMCLCNNVQCYAHFQKEKEMKVYKTIWLHTKESIAMTLPSQTIDTMISKKNNNKSKSEETSVPCIYLCACILHRRHDYLNSQDVECVQCVWWFIASRTISIFNFYFKFKCDSFDEWNDANLIRANNVDFAAYFMFLIDISSELNRPLIKYRVFFIYRQQSPNRCENKQSIVGFAKRIYKKSTLKVFLWNLFTNFIKYHTIKLFLLMLH